MLIANLDEGFSETDFKIAEDWLVRNGYVVINHSENYYNCPKGFKHDISTVDELLDRCINYINSGQYNEREIFQVKEGYTAIKLKTRIDLNADSHKNFKGILFADKEDIIRYFYARQGPASYILN